MGTTWAYVRGCRVGDTVATGSTYNEPQWIFGGVTENEFVSDQVAKCKKLPDLPSRFLMDKAIQLYKKSLYSDLATGWTVQGSNTDRDEELAFYQNFQTHPVSI